MMTLMNVVLIFILFSVFSTKRSKERVRYGTNGELKIRYFFNETVLRARGSLNTRNEGRTSAADFVIRCPTPAHSHLVSAYVLI